MPMRLLTAEMPLRMAVNMLFIILIDTSVASAPSSSLCNPQNLVDSASPGLLGKANKGSKDSCSPVETVRLCQLQHL